MGTRELRDAVAEYFNRFAADFPESWKLLSWIEVAGDADLIRINVYELAGKLRYERRALLELFTDLVFRGLFDLNWEFHCPYCNGITGRHKHLSEATGESACTVCKIRTPFTNELDGNVEVTFSPVERLYQFPAAFIERMTAEMIAQIDAGTLLMPAIYVHGIDCIQLPSFREKFGNEVLSRNESLSIKQICVMFTDIKGSTALYERLGDAKAYRLVREHFDVLFKTVLGEGGTIVKTIGDAVMATFSSADQGVGAALRIQETFRQLARREDIGQAIVVKIGLHLGPSLLVNLNDRSDYFGRTINLASRIEGIAEGGEILVSEALRNDPRALKRMHGGVQSLTRRTVAFKGIDQPQVVFRLNTAAAAALTRHDDSLQHTRVPA